MSTSKKNVNNLLILDQKTQIFVKLVFSAGSEDYSPYTIGFLHMSLVMRKPAFCICENKDAVQLRGNREADQRLCFRYTDSTIPLLPKSGISSP